MLYHTFLFLINNFGMQYIFHMQLSNYYTHQVDLHIYYIHQHIHHIKSFFHHTPAFQKNILHIF